MTRKWFWCLVGFATVVVGGAVVGLQFYADRATRDPRPPTLYCWLLFGPEAKTRVLVRCDDMTLSMDANANGQFEPGERLGNVRDCRNVEIASGDRESGYRIADIAYQGVNGPPWARLRIRVDIRGPRQYSEIGEAEMATAATGAAEIPFDGPLVIREPFADYFRSSASGRPVTLHKTGQPYILQVDVGTFNATSGAAVCPNFGKTSAFPRGVHPVVDIQFPPLREGDPPLRRRYVLDGFC